MRRIAHGLANCKALLVWYSADDPKSRACQWELTEAYLAGEQLGRAADRVLVINREEGNQHIQPDQLTDAAYVRVEDTNWDEVAANIEARCDRLLSLLGQGRLAQEPPMYPTALTPSLRFQGRHRHLWQLHGYLGSHHQASVSGKGRHTTGRTTAVGMGGVGKTLLAEEYALARCPARHRSIRSRETEAGPVVDVPIR